MAPSPWTPAQDLRLEHIPGGAAHPHALCWRPLWALRGCSQSLALGALCWALDLYVHRRIRGLRGGRGWGQLRAAEGEPGRTARQAAGPQPKQAGEEMVAEAQKGEGSGTERGGQETGRQGHE